MNEVRCQKMAHLEIKKTKSGMSYSCKEKTIILNVFKYFRKLYPDKSVTAVVRITSEATGCSEKSVYKFRKEEASPEGLKVPTRAKFRSKNDRNSRYMKFSHTTRQAIRNIFYDLKNKDIVPSTGTILNEIKKDPQLPSFKQQTLRRLLYDMGFYYEKRGNSKSFLVDKMQPESAEIKIEIKEEIIKSEYDYF